MFRELFHSYRLQLRSPDGCESTTRVPLARHLRLTGFTDKLQSDSGVSFRSMVTDYSDASIAIDVSHTSLFLSFPAAIKRVLLNGANAYEQRAASDQGRISLSTPKSSSQSFEFEFPNGSSLCVSAAPSTAKDFIDWIKTFSCPGMVVLGHLVILSLMLISFRNPEVRKYSEDDVSKMTAQVVSFQTQSPIGTGPAEAMSREESLLRKSLKNFKVGPTRPSMTGQKYSGFQNQISSSSSNQNSISKIYFDTGGSGTNEAPLNLSAQQVSAIIEGVNYRLKECYDDILIRDSSLQGRPQIIIQVAKAGTVENLNLGSIQGNARSLQALSQCFKGVFQSVKFPQANQAFAVTQTLVLTR